EGLDRDLALVRLEDLDEARHVGTLEMVRQPHVHVEVRDGVLRPGGAARGPVVRRPLGDAHGMADALDAHLVDGEFAGVGRPLDVRDVLQIARFHEPYSNSRVIYSGITRSIASRMPEASRPTEASSFAGSP